MSSLGPEGQGKRGTYLVGLSRPSETTLLYTLVPWSWGKRIPTSFCETRLRESKPRSKFVWVQKAEGNEAHTWLGSQGQVKRLFSTCWCREAEGNVPQQVFEKPGWGKGKRGTYLVGLSRPSETTLLYTLVPWSWGKWTQQVFEKPGWVKVNPGQILFGSFKSRIQFLGLEGGWVMRKSVVDQAKGNESYIHIYILDVVYI